MPIRLLSEHMASMIAAGEVIERPASVVKELVENSLDAGATEISVEVSGGGSERIRVSDNGSGIPYDEVELAFQRFATSKLADPDDLDAIATLGFRGEALPSIASVARVSVATRAAGEETGARVQVNEGEAVDKRPDGVARGTTITVSRLFRNVPARRKFLRSPATETAHIQNLVARYALAYPEVAFRLTAGRSSMSTPGSGSLREAMAAVHSLAVVDGMLDLGMPDADGYGGGGYGDDGAGVAVSGLISQPSLDRANRGHMSFFVNRRWVQSRMLTFALEQAYRGFLKERRFPMAAVNIELPYGAVDVNAHPAKTEVRFRNGDRVFSALQQAARGVLTAHSPVHPLRGDGGGGYSGGNGGRGGSSPFWPSEPFKGQPTWGDGAGDGRGGYGGYGGDGGGETGGALTPKQTLPMLRALGQIQNTYIVAEGPDGMYLIDQHAAHERVMFDRIKADAANSAGMSQALMEPALVELDERRREILRARADTLAELGMVVEPFGGDAHLIRAVPVILTDADPARALVEALDDMAQSDGGESWFDRAAHSLACHAAIRAGKTLAPEEIAALTRQLERCEQPHTCPHGRPTLIHLSGSRLEREFGRR